MMHNAARPAKGKLGCAVLISPFATGPRRPFDPPRQLLGAARGTSTSYRAQNAIDHKPIGAAEHCENGRGACGLSSRAVLLAHDQSAGQHCSLCTGIGRSVYC